MSTNAVGSKFCWLVLAATTVAVSFAPAAQATPINYDFTVNVTTGPLSGTIANGSFSYDSGSITPGAYHFAMELFTAFDFTFNGIAYDAANMGNLGWLAFDDAGNLNDFVFGNRCSPGGCGVIANHGEWLLTTGFFLYSTPAFNGIGEGDVTYALAPVNVPEPGTPGLFGLGILVMIGLYMGRRRRMC